MMVLTSEEQNKIELLDKIINSLSYEQLQLIAEQEGIISKLSGSNTNANIISKLVLEQQFHQQRIDALTMEVASLKNDIKTLISVINQTVFTVPYNNDFSNMKNRYMVY